MYGPQSPVPGMQHFGFSQEDEHKRSSGMADIQRFEIAIQYQNILVHVGRQSPQAKGGRCQRSMND